MPHTIASQSSAPDRIRQQPTLDDLLSAAAFVPLSGTGWIEITGPDRVRWLNGMVTNSINDLQTSGSGCYNFVLNAQGRIQGDGYVFALEDQLLLETSLQQVRGLLDLLDRFIIMDDVELKDISSARHGLLLAGPSAADILRSLELLPRTSETPALARIPWRDTQVSVIRAYGPLVPRFELWTPDPAVLAALNSELTGAGAVPSSPDTLELLRILEGTPLFGVDIRDRDLPQETGATRALHFAKGCYLGQEIVERIRSRGNVHRTFGGFRLSGETAAAGTLLTVDGKPVGELTSVATLHAASPSQLALGYIRREALLPGNTIRYEGGTAEHVPVPFSAAILGSHPTSNQ